MSQTFAQALITIGIVALATAVTRFVPFILFPSGKSIPRVVSYLGRVLPYSVIGLLIVYCLKDANVAAFPHALPEAISIALIVLVHIWRRNTLLSIALGTVGYMLMTLYFF